MTRRGKVLVFAAFLVTCAAVLLLLARTGDEWALSKESGFYDEPFYLTIKAPSDEIYYTVDGSEPDRDSLRYTEPIYIYDATSDPNVYSNIKDVSLFYDEGLKKLYLEHRLDGGITNVVPDYVSPEYNVSKCRVIRAVYYDKEGKKSDVLTGSYFVGADTEGAADRRGGGESEAPGKAGEGGVSEDDKDGMTVSLIMEPEDLFGYERGICVMGERMEEFMRDSMSGREHDGGDADDDERDEDADDGDDDDGEYGEDEDDP
ncbi:MAG: chitobiase/beta-hexosaminidase C-terminal domain-containing protein, partial [Lachnospiraceae bacterium]|nr:chitobiase/beta-hexosaminidase C-terminal domain-containing protein [Lachnospiraceae bacterium]